jgi:hypothetical protein
MFFKSILTALVMSVPAVASAGVEWTCNMTDHARSKGWISETIVFSEDESGGVIVADSVILYYDKKPKVAKVLRSNDARLVVKWTLENAETDRGQKIGNFDYRASISKTKGSIQVTAIPRHFDSGLQSNGQCTPRTK